MGSNGTRTDFKPVEVIVFFMIYENEPASLCGTLYTPGRIKHKVRRVFEFDYHKSVKECNSKIQNF